MSNIAKQIIISIKSEPKRWKLCEHYLTRSSKKPEDVLTLWIANEDYGIELKNTNPFKFTEDEQKMIHKIVVKFKETKILKILNEV